MAQLLVRFAVKVELRQIHNRFVTDLQLFESESLINGQEVRQRLMKRHAPAVVFTITAKLLNGGRQFLSRADRIGQHNRKVRSHAIGHKALSRFAEKI